MTIATKWSKRLFTTSVYNYSYFYYLNIFSKLPIYHKFIFTNEIILCIIKHVTNRIYYTEKIWCLIIGALILRYRLFKRGLLSGVCLQMLKNRRLFSFPI
nr:MAG TPA: hypothetical protein [Caudoviricetes sp.]